MMDISVKHSSATWSPGFPFSLNFCDIKCSVRKLYRYCPHCNKWAINFCLETHDSLEFIEYHRPWVKVQHCHSSNNWNMHCANLSLTCSQRNCKQLQHQLKYNNNMVTIFIYFNLCHTFPCINEISARLHSRSFSAKSISLSLMRKYLISRKLCKKIDFLKNNIIHFHKKCFWNVEKHVKF